jgi:hypothetical protein
VPSAARKWTICRGLAVTWLKEASAVKVPELGVPATVLLAVRGGGVPMAAVMIGLISTRHRIWAVAISAAEEPMGQLRVRVCVAQAERLLPWAAAWP